MVLKKLLVVFLITLITANTYGGFKDWLGYANTMSRESIAVDGPDTIDSNTLEWVADADPQDSNYYVRFEGTTQPIVYNGRVYAYAKYFEPNEEALGGFDQTNSQLVAYDANSGQMLWNTVIDPASWDSWSSPAVDSKNNNILIASGNVTEDGWYGLPATFYAIDASTGAISWTTELDTFAVNASVCTVVDMPSARAFITDCDLSNKGKLYCINLDANEPNNPYEPGEIVWSQIIGNTCGNTPAYRNGVVYVAAAGDEDSRGTIYAYDATANNAVELWRFTNLGSAEGFYSGVVVTKEGYLYAATCDYYGEEEDNSTLFKIDCNDGSVVWSTPVQATDCVPVVVGDKIYFSGEYEFGVRKVKAYQDLGTSVVKLWETDSYLSIGGWDNQPVYANGKLYIGATSPEGMAYDELYILNVAVTPDDPNFIIAHYTDNACGSSRAVTYDNLYAIGTDGLFKFHQPALLADIDKNSIVNFCDLAELAAVWLYNGPVGITRADLNLDGKVNFEDFSLLAGSWYGESD
jgi:outer membrane protein assembly factor BamB